MRRLGVLVALVCLLSGCGPILSTYLIIAAQADLDGAQAAEAEKYAVYEFTSSKELLHKAREEQGYADYGPAIDYAYKAQEMAKKAREKADDEKRRAMEEPSAAWEAPSEAGQQPSVIIKKKDEQQKIKVVPIPTEQPK
jgi:hypothetical protein